jgi:tetratricopeptide (TPR) repeat protein
MATPATPEFEGNPRFQLQRRLGAGGFGVVYEALDRETGRTVALKSLHHTDPESLYRFKQEFRGLVDVTHPNLVSLYELLSDREHWFFTMELVEGVDFLSWVRGDWLDDHETLSSAVRPADASDAPRGDPWVPRGSLVDLKRLRAALVQLAQGVLALHEAGKLHRDIKPSNVMVAPDARVVLLDFGLLRDAAGDGSSSSSQIVGTPAYMSPEQGAGQEVTAASDWYAVGVMLFEALAGRLPFTGRGLQAIVEKLNGEAPSPRDVSPDVPEDLDTLCRDLLARSPAARPTGRDVLRRLGAPEAAPAAAQAAPFVGRDGELQALRDAFAAASGGRTVTVAVHGPSGVGKTALVRRFLDEVRLERRAVVLGGRCYERETVPYKALDGVVDALSRHLRRTTESEAAAVAPRDIGPLLRVFPVLRQVQALAAGRARLGTATDVQELRRRASLALRELLTRVADRDPLVVFVDDIQWGDADSAALLTELLKPPDPPALLFVACYRTDEAALSPLLRDVLPRRQTVSQAIESREIVLGALQPDAVRALALALLPGAPVEAEQVAQESGGHPLLVTELARHARERPRTWRDVPLTLDALVLARLDALPAPSRALLEVLSLAARPLPAPVAVAAAQVDDPGLVDRLVKDRLVRSRPGAAGEEIEPYHDRVRVAAISAVPPARIPELHRALANALAAARSDPETLAVHFWGCGDTGAAASYALQAARQASDALAFDQSARLYRMALSLSSQLTDRGALRLALAEALAGAGRGGEAGDAYLEALSGADPVHAIELRRRAAHQYLVSGRIEDGLAELRVVLSAHRMALPRTTGGALAGLFLRRSWLRLRGLGFRERHESEVPPLELMRIDTCWSVSMGLGLVDLVRGADFQSRHLLLALRTGEPYRVARALAMEAAYVSSAGGRAGDRRRLLSAEARTLAERVDHPHAIGLATMTEGVAAWTEGRFREALEKCRAAEKMLRERCTDVSWEIASAQMYGVAALFLLGEVRQFCETVPALVKEALQRGNLLSATNLRIGYFAPFVHLVGDAPERARQDLREAMDAWTRGFDLPHLWARGAESDIALYAGDPIAPEPIRSGRLLALALDRLMQPALILGRSARARRRLAAAAQLEGPARDTQIQGALLHARTMERERMPWGDGLAHLIRAGACSLRGDREGALRDLRLAEDLFVAADMTLHLQAARLRRGTLEGGAAGLALAEEAQGWMRGQGIVRPDRITDVLVPGFRD